MSLPNTSDNDHNDDHNIDNPKQAAAFIFLHGLGDTPAGWSWLAATLPQIQPRLAKNNNIQYVFPPAPTIPISIRGGTPMTAWFDVTDWPITVDYYIPHDDVNDGMEKAVQQIQDIITDLETNKGIPRNRIVVGGFSQGGAIALLTAYYDYYKYSAAAAASDNNNPPPPPPPPKQLPLAACVNLSGWLPLTEQQQQQQQQPILDAQVAATPLFWAHGIHDDKVLFAQQDHGVRQLQQWGLRNIQTHQYPMGHSSHPDELHALATFLDNVLFGDNKQKQRTRPQQEL